MENKIKTSDKKALTIFNVYHALKAIEEGKIEGVSFEGEKNRLILITNFGMLLADRILPQNHEYEQLDAHNFSHLLLKQSIKNTSDMLIESGDEEVLFQQKSLILENVTIHPYGSDATSTLPMMILFSDQVVGITFGDRD
jgi:hypothetical protein